MKRAIVLGGGGSKGAYQIGVWKGLSELSYNFDIVCGSSVGSLNGAFMVQNDLDAAIKLWGSVKTRDVMDMKSDIDIKTMRGKRKLLYEVIDNFVKEGGFDPSPLEKTVRRLLDEDKIRNSNIDFGLVTVEYPSMRPLVLTKENIPKGMLCDYLMASSACYPAVKSRDIEGKRYIDGGYYSNLPVEIALSKGADEIIAVDLEAVGIVRPAKLQDVKFTRVHSRWDLGLILSFDPDTSKRNMALGYNDILKALGNFEGDYYTFYPGESALNRILIKGAMKNSVEKFFVDDGVSGGKFLRVLAQQSLRKIIGGHPGLATAATIRGWAESAARVMNVDPTSIYTFQKLNSMLLKKTADIDPPHSQALGHLGKLESGQKSAPLEINKEHILIYLRQLIEGAQENKDMLDAVAVLANLFPDEFLGALYIFLLDEAYTTN